MKSGNIFKGLKRGLIVLFVLAATAATAANATVYYSINTGADAGNDTAQGGIVYLDTAKTTKVATGSLVQYIRVGTDHAKNAPDSSKTNYIGGDDALASQDTVGNDTVWTTFSNKAGQFYHNASGSFTGTDTSAANIYVRIWNASTIAGSSYYVDSAVFTPNVSTIAPQPGNDIGTGDLICNIPKPVAVILTSIAVTPANPSIALGLTQNFTATGTYSDTSTKNITSQVTWASGTPATATINSAGMATSVAQGTTSITASLSGITSPAQTLTVTAPTLMSIAVTPINPTINQGTTQQFTAMGTYTNGAQNVTNQVLWTSTNTGVATISIAGLATSVAAGTTNITATIGTIISPAQTLTVAAAGTPTITQLEKTSNPGVAITSASVSDGISIIGNNFGAAQGTSTVTINGTAVTTFYYWNNAKIDLQVPTGATSGNVVVTVGGVASNGKPLTISNLPASLSITTTSLPGGTVGTAYNQTLQAINGTTPYTWTITTGSLPAGLSLSTAGVISGTPTTAQTANFTVQVADNASHTATQALAITVSNNPIPAAIIIDDFEGGCVGKWATNADGGYYTFQDGMMTPDNDHITPNGPDPSAAKNGALGMKVKFSYVKNADSTKDWGDGWGAQLHKVLDLSPMKSVTMNIRWDGSANAVKFGFQDALGHVYVANIPNSALMAVSGYGPISIPVSSFAEDTTNKSRVAGAIDWAHITNYNFAYLNQGTTTDYQYIDDITALTTSEPNPINAPVINSITPNSAPTGTLITVVGLNFSPVQGMSTLTFTNTVTNVLYQASVISWSDTMIQAQVPQLATIGTYEVMVNKMAVSQGVVTVQQSNQSVFQVTAQSGGLATIYPNPFNPNSQVVNIIFTQPAGATNIGVYYYDMTARLVKKDMLYSVSQTTWDGKNQNGAVVGDGVYLLRIVNEDTKSLIAKGKILVVKH